MLRRSACLLVVVVSSAVGQFRDLTTTDDGSRLYFSSPLRLKGANQYLHPKLFVWDSTGVRLLAQRDTGQPIGPTVTNFYSLAAPEVSADGSVLAFTASRHCNGGGVCPPVERSQGNIMGLPGRDSPLILSGHVTMSRNARFALAYECMVLPQQGVQWIDLGSGETVRILEIIGGAVHRRLANDGTLVFGRGSGLVLWRKSGQQTLRASEPAAGPLINDDASRIVFESLRRLLVYDIPTGSETVLAVSPRPFQASMSGDGSVVLFLLPVRGAAQLFVIRSDGSDLRQLTGAAGFPAPARSRFTAEPSESVTEATLSGDGRIAFAATDSGRLLRIDVASGQTQELIPRTPYITGVDQGAVYPSAILPAVPGTLMRLLGSGLAASATAAETPLPTELAGVRLRLAGVNVPLLRVSPVEIRWQAPWDLPEGSARLELLSGDSSPFESGPGSVSVNRAYPTLYGAPDFSRGSIFYVLALHSQFDGPVTFDNPARPGEVIHIYAGGLGPVAPPVPAGVPAPFDPLAALAYPLQCQFWDGGPNDADVLFAGLAPSFIGVYQVSVRVPVGLRLNRVAVTCRLPTFSLSPSASGSIPVRISSP